MRIRVIYDSDGTVDRIISGHRVSTQILEGRRAVITVYNRRGKVVRVLQLSRVYEIDKGRHVRAQDLR